MDEGANRRRTDAAAIFAAALAAADPGRCVERALSVTAEELRVAGTAVPWRDIDRVLVVGAGKATPAMAAAAETILGDRVATGAITTKYGHGRPLRRIATTEAGHPVPDEAGVAGAERILELLSSAGERDLVLGLFSGGGSALMPAPAHGLTLADKQETTRLLLASGASIDEVNAVRKHLSAAKGGWLARVAQPARVACLLLSDVIGDPPGTIASGPTAPDDSTYADCLELARRYRILDRLPDPVRRRLEQGAAGQMAETPKAGDACFSRVATQVVGNNALSLAAARDESERRGYRSLLLSSRIQGEAREVAAVYAALAQEISATGSPLAPPACLLLGGETTVTLRGQGRGGRNQELALAAAIRLAGHEQVTLLSAGTDGTDGPTDAAGAIVDGGTVGRAAACGLAAAHHLEDNDAYPLLAASRDLLVTGATGTNVMDLHVILVTPSA